MIDDPDRRDDPPADKSPTFGSDVGTSAATFVPSGDEARGVAAAVPDQRPEVLVGAAFAGGVAFALVLRRIAS